MAVISHGWSRFWHLACSLPCLPAPRQPGLLSPVQLLVLVKSLTQQRGENEPGHVRSPSGLVAVLRAAVSHGQRCHTLLSVFGNSWRPQAVSCSLTRPCPGMLPATAAWPPTLRGRHSSTPGSTCTVTPNRAVHTALHLSSLCSAFSPASAHPPLSSLSLSHSFSKE